jgi:hypothetical protein
MRRLKAFLLPLVILGLFLGVQLAFGQVITSTIYGTVTDPSGAAIPGATITATSEDSGATASVATNTAGEFTLGSLQPGRYTIQIEANGFKTQKQTGLDVAGGQRVRVTYALEVGSVSTTVEITATAPLINTVNAEQRTNLGATQITELPTARRDWTNLLNLNAGVSSDGMSVSLNGLPGGSLRFTVDGTDASANSEQPNISMYQNFNFVRGVSIEAVDEVNVAKGIASAEVANTMSGNVNIITKRGTNEFHGSLFELNQTENLNARDQTLRTKPPLVYNQFGGSVGGPIIKNKLFAFGVYEGYRLRGFQALNGTVPTQEFRTKAIAAVAAYKPFFDIFPLPNQPYTAGAITGTYVGADSQKGQDNHAIARVDWNMRNDTIVTGRYTRGRPGRRDPRVTQNYRDFLGQQEIGTVGVIHTAGRWTSESRFGVNYNSVNRVDNIYTLNVGGGITGNLGFSDAGETLLLQGTTWSLDQIFGMTIGRHSLRTGGHFDQLRVSRENIETPEIQYANEADFLANIPNRIQVTWGVNYFLMKQENFGVFVQDDFKLSRRLVLNMGVRWDHYTVPNEKDGRLFNRSAPWGFGPLRDPDSIYDAKYDNFSPRVGFAYTMDESGKTVLRTGFGTFYNPRLVYGGPVDIVKNAIDEPNRLIFSRDEALKYPVLRYPVINSNVLPLAKGLGLEGTAALQTDWGNPHSYQWTFSLQHQFTKDMALEASYVGTLGRSLMMVLEVNQPNRLTGIRPVQPEKYATFRYRNEDEHSSYHGLQLNVRKRLAGGFMANMNYAWSKTLSFSGDADLLLPNSPQDVYNIKANRGPANLDRTHRFYADFLYDVPFEKLSGSKSGASRLLLGGWQVNGIFYALSGDPFNVSFPGYTEQRPDVTGQTQILDDWQSTHRYLNQAAYAQIPLSSAGYPVRPGNLSRNSVYGPGWWRLDMGIGKSTRITEQMRFQLRFDLFNAFNHTNLSGIRNDIRRSDFGVLTGTRGARTVQINLRLVF